jgi:uncharacterized protein (TIGR03066 family)
MEKERDYYPEPYPMKRLRYALVACCLCALSGCSGKAFSIVGTWEQVGVKGALPTEYSSDGKIFVSVLGQKAQIGTYVIEGDTLKMTEKNGLTGKEATKVLTIKKLTDKELVLEFQGQESNYIRK